MSIIAVLLSFLFLIEPSCELSAKATQDYFTLYNEAITAYRSRRFNEAKEKFSKILEDSNNDSSYKDTARIMLAQIFKDGKEHDKAIKLYKEVIEKNMHFGHKIQAQNNIIEIYYVTQRYKEGIEYINELKKTNKDNYDLDLKLSDFYIQLGQIDEAWLLLEHIFNINPQKNIFQKRIELATKTNEIKRLMSEIESQETNITKSSYIDYITDCQLALKDRKKAVDTLIEYLDKAYDIEITKKLTRLLADDNRHIETITYLERLVKTMPNDAEIAKSLGHEYFVIGNKEKAIEAWKRPFENRERTNDAAIFFTNALIEHGLYEEALQAFDNYRRLMYNPTKFAEEKANVLYALNRRSEAMEEYLASFIENNYTQETFEKLYEEKSPDFDLEKRLNVLYEKYRNTALAKALMELYFTRAKNSDIDKLKDLVFQANGELDELFYERFKQNPNKESTEFGYNLLEKIIKARSNSLLALKLANKSLELAPEIPEFTIKLYELASSININIDLLDYETIAEYYANMAEISLYTMHKPDDAIKYANKLIDSEIAIYSESSAIKANLIKSYALICKDDFKEAENIQNKIKKYVNDANFYDKTEYENIITVCNAWLYSYKGDYQKALDIIKPLVESNSTSSSVNDAIELALFITRYSIGDGLAPLDKIFKIRRLTLAGKEGEAEKELKEFITENASATSIIEEAKADLIMLREKTTEPEELIKQIDTYFVTAKTLNKKMSDLLELKIKLLYNSNNEERLQSMKTFLKYFGSDLRSERYRRIIAESEATK